jgi:hypothetical protein
MSYLITKQPFWDMVFIQIMKSRQHFKDKEGNDPEVQWIINDINATLIKN